MGDVGCGIGVGEGEGVGVGRDGVEDATDGADEVEVDDGAPGDTFGVECGGGVEELEFCGRDVIEESDRRVEEWNAGKMWKRNIEDEKMLTV